MLSERSSGAELPDLLNQLVGRPRSKLPAAQLRLAALGGREKTSDDAILYPCCSKEDVAMRTTFDFAPLFRSSIGFDRLLDTLEAASRLTSLDNWPPYDIVRTGEDDYHISMAVAGLTEDDLTITQEQNMLRVTGQKVGDDEDSRQYLHRGIAGRTFQRRFELADYVKVVGAGLV